MDTPFPYSQHVTGKQFVGRKGDVKLMGNLLSQGEHICLYEPPKSGITSLIQQALFDMRLGGKAFSVGQMSALNIHTPEAFLLRFGSTVLRTVASTPDEYLSLTGRYLEGTHFVFDPRSYADGGQVLSLGWELDREDVMAMLRLPFRLAADRKERLILIVDQFHCLGQLPDPDLILRPLDAVLREQQLDGRLFNLILCGAGVNAMKAIFETSLLFHRVVERVRLSALGEQELSDHMQRGFLSGGKVVNQDLILGACRLLRCHPWYVNHFAAICNSMSRGYIMEPVFVDALGCLISIHQPRFTEMVTGLTTHQVNLLQATLCGITRFSAADVIRSYGLNSSANVKRVKDALMKKEILLFNDSDTPSLQDPLFEYWLKKYYFDLKL